MTKTSGIRKQSVRTAGLVFAPRQQVREDFDLPAAEFFWLNSESGATKATLEEALRPLAAASPRRGGGERPMATGVDTPRPPRGELSAAASSTPAGAGPAAEIAAEGRRGGGPGRGSGGGRGPGGEPVQVTLLSDVRDGLRTRGGLAIQAMGYLPLITLLVVSLGVVNTIAASVRARRWEFGVLRAVGVTRWRLSRLVLSEAILVGFVASVLSLAFGLLTGWTCLGLIRYVSNPWFEGVATPLVIPWGPLAYGYALTFALCFVAALWPAASAGRSEPLALLQAGRSST